MQTAAPPTTAGTPALAVYPGSTREAGHRLGRSALIVHALGYAFVVAAWVVMLLVGEYTSEGEAVQGVGGAAGIVLAFFSAWLAARALYVGEKALPAVLNLVWFGLEVTGPCVLMWWPPLIKYRVGHDLWDLAMWLGLPLFVPFLALTAAVCVPLATWLVRRKETRRKAAGLGTWSRRTRWRAGGWRYLVASMVLGLLLVPPALYLFTVLAPTTMREGVSWHQMAVTHTPDFVKRGVEWAVRKVESGSPRIQRELLEEGRLPVDVLEARALSGSGEVVIAALCGLKIADPGRCNEIYLTVFERNPGQLNNFDLSSVARWTAHFLAPESCGRLFEAIGGLDSSVRTTIAIMIGFMKDPERGKGIAFFLEDNNPTVFNAILFAILRDPPRRKQAVSFLDDPDLTRRRLAAYQLSLLVTVPPIPATYAAVGQLRSEPPVFPPDTPAEQAERELVKQAAEKWLLEQPTP